MSERDPIDELVMLCRAAAEAGEDWRGRLRDEWVPRMLASVPRPTIAASLHEWGAPEEGGDPSVGIEALVVEEMAGAGYD